MLIINIQLLIICFSAITNAGSLTALVIDIRHHYTNLLGLGRKLSR